MKQNICPYQQINEINNNHVIGHNPFLTDICIQKINFILLSFNTVSQVDYKLQNILYTYKY